MDSEFCLYIFILLSRVRHFQ